MKTKKILVAFDRARPKAQSSDFAVPIKVDGTIRLVGLSSGKSVGMGMIVFLGREVTVNDIFAKLVDSGQKVVDVDEAVRIINDYITMLQDHKVGNIVSVEASPDSPEGFSLVKLANSPSGASGLSG